MPDSTNTGGRKPRVTDDDLLDVFRATADPVLSTAEVADAVPIKRRGTLNRLRDLEDAGTLDSKQIGGRNTVWWLVEEVGRSRPTPDQSPTNSDAEVRGSVDTSLADELAGEDTADQQGDAVGDLDTSDERRAAVRACIDYLREQETAQKSGFVEAVYPEHPAGFGSSGGWWNKIGKEYLQTVAEQDGSITPPAGEGSHTWHYTGDDVQTDGGVYDPTAEFDQ